MVRASSPNTLVGLTPPLVTKLVWHFSSVSIFSPHTKRLAFLNAPPRFYKVLTTRSYAFPLTYCITIDTLEFTLSSPAGKQKHDILIATQGLWLWSGTILFWDRYFNMEPLSQVVPLIACLFLGLPDLSQLYSIHSSQLWKYSDNLDLCQVS